MDVCIDDIYWQVRIHYIITLTLIYTIRYRTPNAELSVVVLAEKHKINLVFTLGRQCCIR